MTATATGETAVHRGRTAFGPTLEAGTQLVATDCGLIAISVGYHHWQTEGLGYFPTKRRSLQHLLNQLGLQVYYYYIYCPPVSI